MKTIVVIVIVLGVAALFLSPRNPQPPEPPLTAHVSHLGSKFVITNNDTFDWRDCDLDLNSDYQARRNSVSAGQTIELQTASFVKSDGTSFNWLTTKPMQLQVYCRQAPQRARSTLVGWR